KPQEKEKATKEKAESKKAGREKAEKQSDESRDEEQSEREGGNKDSRQTSGAKSASDVPATPTTRRLAREIGVDITQVSGSGPGGRITAADVKDASRGGESSGGAGGGRSDGGAAAEGNRREKMTKVRSLTAERTMKSWRTIPHVTQFDEADMTGLNRYMEAAAPKVEKAGGKLTVTAVLVKLVAHALRAYPRFNAQIDMEAGEIEYQSEIAIGIAADTERGLLVPVVRNPDRKSITSLAIEIVELAKKARSGELEVSQMRGGTFSISNLGGIGGTAFTPVVVEPQVAILGVARAKTQPVHVNGRFEPRPILPLSLSYDHRAIDGADGARFVSWIKTAIEDPLAALMEGEQ
ncbi:MAG: dihydrolipoamide acetyltransferase family protein, partial [Spirochaetales bacterium]